MRVLCRFCLSAVAAICLCVWVLPEGLFFAAGGVAAILGLLCLLLREKRRRTAAALVCFGLALGFLWTGGCHRLLRAPALALDQRTAVYAFTVTDYPSPTRWGLRVPVRLHTGDRFEPVAVLYGDEADLSPLRPGDELTGLLTPRAIHRQLRNRIDYNQSRGIFLTADGTDLHIIHSPVDIPVRFLHREFAHRLKTGIAAAFPEDVSGLAAALVTGDKSLLPPGLYAAFQRSGLSHVVAVSGLHVSVLIGALIPLFGRGRRLTALLGVTLALFFAFSVGSTPSVLRAVLMAGLLLLAPLVNREPDGPTTWAVSLLLLLLACPWAAASVGLQLSFAAVGGIWLIADPLTERWMQRMPHHNVLRPLLRAILYTISTTLGALLFTTPLAALYFGLFSPAGLLTNLLALWAVSLTFLGALVTGLLSLVLPGGAALVAAAAAWPARYVTALAVGIGRLPFAALDLSSPYLLGWGVFTYVVLGLILWRRGKGLRPVIPLTACVVTLAAALVLDTAPLRGGAVRLTVLNPEGGSAALICSRDHAIALNCGSRSGADPGDLTASCLLAQGLGRLDALVLTDCTRDHADGVPQLLARIPTQTLYLPARHEGCERCAALAETAAAYGCTAVHLDGDTQLEAGPVRVTVWKPAAVLHGHSVHCAVENFHMLFTGDLDPELESRLARTRDLPHADLLVTEAGHLPDPALLLETAPDSVVLTGGWVHPRILEQLGAAGCAVWPAHHMGTITFTIPRK